MKAKGYVTLYDNLCTDGITIDKKTFAHMDGALVPLTWNFQHDTSIGRVLLEAREDGVYGYIEVLDETMAGLIRDGEVTSLAIYANQIEYRDNVFVTSGTIREVAFVLVPANPGCEIDEYTEEELEDDDA